MRAYCTLFDQNYLFKGLAMRNSLIEHDPEAEIWILCMDELTLRLLDKLSLERTHLIPITELERSDLDLNRVKSERTPVEYCWTLTPILPLYLFKRRSDLEMITYLDADLLFFGSPEPIFTEFGQSSILIVEHRFPIFLQYKEKHSGRFNVEFVSFRRNKNGLTALEWWRDRCIEWCFFRYEDGKLGDQLYLNDWPERFHEVHILKHTGAGLAPWNVLNYTYEASDDHLLIDGQPLIFYHFHSFKLLGGNRYLLAPNYGLPKIIIQRVYRNYQQALLIAQQTVRSISPQFQAGFSSVPTFKDRVISELSAIKMLLLGTLYAKSKSSSR